MLFRSEFADVPFKVGVEQQNDAFWKLTIKVKKQIVADGLKPADYDVTNVGTHLSAREFNALLEEPETEVVGMRKPQHFVALRQGYGAEKVNGRVGLAAARGHTSRQPLSAPVVGSSNQERSLPSAFAWCTAGVLVGRLLRTSRRS